MAPSQPDGGGATIDFGAHLLPDAEPNPFNDWISETAGGPVHRDPSKARAVFDAAGVDEAVLSNPMYMGSDDAEAAAAANDSLLEVVEADPGFHGLAALPTAAGGEAAASELVRSIEAGYNGAAVETMSAGIELVDDELEPVFEAATETGAPLFVHPKLDDSLGGGVLDDTWALNATFGREVALCDSICKVIHEGVFDRYPELTMVYHHTGGNIAAMMGRVELQLERDLWIGLEETKPFAEFEAQLRNNVYIDTAGHYASETSLTAAQDVFPSTNILFGSDFPYETRTPAGYEKLLDRIEAVTGPEDRRRILGGNARDVLLNVD